MQATAPTICKRIARGGTCVQQSEVDVDVDEAQGPVPGWEP